MALLSKKKIVFLDSDHVLDVVRNVLDEPTDAADAALRAFFAPESVDVRSIRALGARVREGVSAIVCTRQDVRDANAIVFRRGAVTRQVMSAAPHLALIQRLGERADGIDLIAAKERGIAVSCLPRRTLAYTAEHAILLMLALAKKLIEADAAVRDTETIGSPSGPVAYNWCRFCGLGGLHGHTLGIVGMGEVGALVARRARAFGMRVLYTARDRLSEDSEGALQIDYRAFPDLLAESDFVSLHVRGTAPNARIIDAAAIARMRPGAFLINTARGNLVDEDALYEALTGGRLGGAGLDVHWPEPRAGEDRFCRLPNVVLTPHIAGGSRLGVLAEVKAIVENVDAALRGRAPIHGRLEETVA